MRGKLGGWKFRKSHGRIIPAHAGQTALFHHRRRRAPDHPRACGANKHGVSHMKQECGSSPRMRGKRPLTEFNNAQIRIIPAHAGQTSASRRAYCHNTDHPRACGANVSLWPMSKSPDGSSPRMRGKRLPVVQAPVARRIIPAHAGQTRPSESSGHAARDHPRACGANRVDFAQDLFDAGSSPRMRGKPPWCRGRRPCRRIIPAHAGQTALVQGTPAMPPDHPRACGANSGPLMPVHFQPGSSPRMRGKRHDDHVPAPDRRIIPAHAGQTTPATPTTDTITDHPRACGANAVVLMVVANIAGSSPRMRGKPHVRVDGFADLGIIPAHAGQTPILCENS